MKSEYTPDELLPLSGIQHFIFCRRQWALIYVEMQWQDSALTAEGKILHQRVENPFFTEARKGVITARSVPVASYHLGLSGICDVVEFTESAEGIALPGRSGLYLPAPVEYKRGKPKQGSCDAAQMCAQAICLEEMLSVKIPTGYIFYWQTRRRQEFALTDELRDLVQKTSQEMHAYFQRGYTPRVKPSKACRSCSLADLCLPVLLSNPISASRYIQHEIEKD